MTGDGVLLANNVTEPKTMVTKYTANQTLNVLPDITTKQVQENVKKQVAHTTVHQHTNRHSSILHNQESTGRGLFLHLHYFFAFFGNLFVSLLSNPILT